MLTFCRVFVLYLLFKSEQLIKAIKLQKRMCNYTENYCCGGLNFLKHLTLILSTELNKLTSHNKRLTRIDEGILFNIYTPSFQPLTVVSLIKHNFMFGNRATRSYLKDCFWLAGKKIGLVTKQCPYPWKQWTCRLNGTSYSEIRGLERCRSIVKSGYGNCCSVIVICVDLW